MRAHTKMQRQLDTAAAQRRCLHPTNAAVHQALLRRKQAGEIISPMPGLFISRTVWEPLDPIAQMVHLVRGLAHWHPHWVFAGVAAACVHGMWVDYRTVQSALRQRMVPVVCNTRGNHADSRHIHRLWSASGEYSVVCGVRVTTPAHTAAVCANSMQFMPAMEVMCCALRNGMSNTEVIACATSEGMLNANAQNVFRFATPFAENGGEARALAAFIMCGFEPPAQQVEFVDPQTGKRYRVDFLWRARDGRIVVVELDGLVKYRDPQMMDGRTLGGVIDDERERSEGLSRAGVDVIVRIRMDDLHDLDGLKQQLARAGVPLRRG